MFPTCSIRTATLLLALLDVCFTGFLVHAHAITWSDGHKNCFGVFTSTGVNKTCHEASYMYYVRSGLKTPKSDFHSSILQAVLDLYDDLEEARIPAMINLDPHHVHNSTRRLLLHPISFCLPEELIRRTVPPKAKSFGRVIPGEKSTYFTLRDEAQYYEDMQQSLFAITYKKGGWDCLRHVEILAAGTLPLFPNIKNCPHQALTAHPKKLYRLLLTQPGLDLQAVRTDLHHMRLDVMQFDSSQLDRELYSAVAAALLQYTRNVLSTRATAEYVLRTMHTYGKGRVPAVVKKVFYLTHQDHDMDKGDYMTDFLLHGLKELLGPEAVTDFPRRDGLYKTVAEFNKTDYYNRRESLYGFGFTWGLTIDSITESSSRDWAKIDERIEAHYYDIVILGSGHRDGWASKLHWWDQVCKYYDPLEVGWVDGSDNHAPKKLLEKYHTCAGHMFSREGYTVVQRRG